MTNLVFMKPLSQTSEVVDKNRRWTPDWYSWLAKVSTKLNPGNVADLKRDFGAKGGFNDDTAAFTAAFSWLNDIVDDDRGRVLVIPPGEYTKTGTHTLTRSQRTIMGYGSCSAIFQMDDSDSIVLQSADPVNDFMGGCTLRDFYLRRTFGSSANNGIDIKLVAQYGDIVQNVSLDNSVHGIQILGGDTIYFDNFVCTGCQELAGVRSGSALFEIKSLRSGATVQRNANVIVLNNFNISANTTNIEYDVRVQAVDTLIMGNGHLGAVGVADLFLDVSDATNNTDFISNLLCNNVFFDGVSQVGVYLPSSAHVQSVFFLKFANCHIGGQSSHGMQFDYATKDTLITGCNIRDNTSFGLIVGGSSGTTGFTVTGNRFNNNGTDFGGDAIDNATTVFEGNNPDKASIQTTPTVTSQTGSLTTASCTVNKRKFGKYVFFDLEITITTNGTGATGLQISSFGTTPVREVAVYGDKITAGKAVQGRLTTGGALTDIFFYDATYPGGNGTVIKMSGFCEVA